MAKLGGHEANEKLEEATGQQPQWPPPDAIQAQHDVAQEDMQRQAEDMVQQAMPAQPPAAANGGAAK